MSMEGQAGAIAERQVQYGGAGMAVRERLQEKGEPRELAGAEAFTGNVLRYGVFFSIGVCVLGSILYFLDHGLGGSVGPLIRYSPNPAFPHSLSALASGLSRFGPSSIIAVGLLLLVALRVFQVLLSGAIFAARRNFKFVFISLFVFVVLMSSLFLGKAGG